MLDPFEYIYGLTTIVVGLVVTRLVTGQAQLLQTRRRIPTYWVHSLWMLNTLLAVIILWWVQFRWRRVEHWTLPLVLWLLASPLTFSFASALLFPNEQEGEPIRDWRRHYYEAHRGFFLLFAATFLIDFIDSLLKGVPYFLSLGPLYFGTMGLQVILSVIAALTQSPRFHGAFCDLLSRLQHPDPGDESSPPHVMLGPERLRPEHVMHFREMVGRLCESARGATCL